MTSTFADDWRNGLTQDSSCTDVKFLIAPNSLVINAHKIILASSSVIFKEMFLSAKKSNQVPKKYNQLFEEIKWVHTDRPNSYLNDLNHPASGINEMNDSECVEITLNQSISFDVFIRILEFLYTGLPGFTEIEDADFILEVKQTAELFHLHWLSQVCENRIQDETFLNPSIGTWLNDDAGSNMKRLFFNKPLLSDVQFRVEGQLIYAHKAVLTARCDVMGAMLGGAFMESRSSTEVRPPRATTLSLSVSHVCFPFI
jgi:Rho family protein